jgi:hypothetical protein
MAKGIVLKKGRLASSNPITPSAIVLRRSHVQDRWLMPSNNKNATNVGHIHRKKLMLIQP